MVGRVRWDPSTHDRAERKVMSAIVLRLFRDEQGQDLIEYALLAGFISLAVVTAVTNVGTSLNTLYETVESQVDDAAQQGGAS